MSSYYDENTNDVILDYTARDFEAIREMIVGVARGVYPEWQTVGEANDFGTVLLEMYAYVADVTNFYIDRVAAEAFIQTATLRESVNNIAEMMGYRPIGQRAALCEVKFTIDPAHPADITIPAKTRLLTDIPNQQQPFVFETDHPITLYMGGEAQYTTATEGLTTDWTTIHVSVGNPALSVRIPEANVIQDSVAVRTREGTFVHNNSLTDTPNYIFWTEIDAVSTARPNQSAYATRVDDAGYTYLIFGDGSAGRIPPVGAEIDVTYRSGRGAAANSVAIGDISIIDSMVVNPAFCSVTNPTIPVGGANPESLESMRKSIPKARRIRDRAVSLKDYADLAIQVPGVEKAVSFGQIYSAVSIKIAPVGDRDTLESKPLMDALAGRVSDYMSDKVMIGSVVYVDPAEISDFYLSMEVHVKPGYGQQVTLQEVRGVLYELASYVEMDIDEELFIGEVYRAAMKIDGVDWVNILHFSLSEPVTEGATSGVVENLKPLFGSILQFAPIPTDVTDINGGGLKLFGYGGVVAS